MTLDPAHPAPPAEAERSSSKLVLALVLAHAVLAGVLASVLNVWLDEAFSLESTGSGIATAFRRSITFEMQPPLYFTLLAAWRSIASGYVFARMLSVACTMGVLWIVARLWRRLRPDVHPGWVVAALAFHPFTIYAAVEIRLYALAMLLSALLLALYLGEYAGEGRSPARKLAFTAVSVAALWTLRAEQSGQDPVALARAELNRMTSVFGEKIRDPGLLRDLADLAEGVCGPAAEETAQQLRAFAGVHEAKDKTAYLQRLDPDLAIAIRVILDLPEPQESSATRGRQRAR